MDFVLSHEVSFTIKLGFYEVESVEPSMELFLCTCRCIHAVDIIDNAFMMLLDIQISSPQLCYLKSSKD